MYLSLQTVKYPILRVNMYTVANAVEDEVFACMVLYTLNGIGD
jgi:hypothetical protein